jgi:hypothetical protein
MILATPVLVRPPLRMNTAHTVTTAGLLNPERASDGVISAVTANVPSVISAVASMGIHSVMRNTTEMARMDNTRAISMVTAYNPLISFSLFPPAWGITLGSPF